MPPCLASVSFPMAMWDETRRCSLDIPNYRTTCQTSCFSLAPERVLYTLAFVSWHRLASTMAFLSICAHTFHILPNSRRPLFETCCGSRSPPAVWIFCVERRRPGRRSKPRPTHPDRIMRVDGANEAQLHHAFSLQGAAPSRQRSQAPTIHGRCYPAIRGPRGAA